MQLARENRNFERKNMRLFKNGIIFDQKNGPARTKASEIYAFFVN